MSCCSNKRTALKARSVHNTYSPAYANVVKKPVEDVYLEYTGNSALTITGNITGKRYRFAHTGDQQPVDHSDAGAMMILPMIKKVSR